MSISLGTSKRDKVSEISILGQPFRLERIGTNGDLEQFAKMFRDLDGVVDALGVGGADINVVLEDRRYAFWQIEKLVAGAVKTPVVDGGGLKHTLERTAIQRLQSEGIVDFKTSTSLLVSAVDRFGMAQALVEQGGKVIFGDLLFGLGLPCPMRSYRQVLTIGSIVLPIITRLPFKWIYPTGEKQEQRSPKFQRYFDEAQIICGDWHYIRRYAPNDLTGKVIITQTVRSADLRWLASANASKVITTTPSIGGESFATNVMEGVVVALLGKKASEVSDSEFRETLQTLGWGPNIIDLKSIPDSEINAKGAVSL